jgi:DegV family protein with EDD domain
MTVTSPGLLKEMDGRFLYYAFIAGGKKVLQHQVDLNRINVFPVNDGDTGTNLAATIRSVIDSLRPHKSYKVTADRIAEATLMNARGNSGIIFAQFFYGISSETGELNTVNVRQFAEIIYRSVRYVYEAVAKPVEGTMLTVIRDMAEYINNSWSRFSDFNNLLIASHEILKKSLMETTSKLAVLGRNKVVDAGAKGFVLFIEGILEFIASKNIKDLLMTEDTAKDFIPEAELNNDEFQYRYCTEAVIKDCRPDKRTLKGLIEKYGDSVVIAGSDRIRRLHIHTNTPSELFETLRGTGSITYQKADDMFRHIETVNNRKWKIALVTDSTCDLPQELFDRYQINMLPIGISFGENQYLDKVTIQPEQFYSLLSSVNEIPKTAQVNETAFLNLYSHLATYYDSVIAVHLGEKLSGTLFSSQKAARKISREFGKPVTVINSRNVSGALGLIVLRVAQSIENGDSHDKIVSLAERWSKKTKIFVSVKTLKFMIRGGRVSASRGLIARILNINPIVSIDETGKAIVFDKSFSQKSNMKKVMKHIKQASGKKKIWNYVILHAENPKAAEWYSAQMEVLAGKKPVSVVNISPVVGANAGIGAASVALSYD